MWMGVMQRPLATTPRSLDMPCMIRGRNERIEKRRRRPNWRSRIGSRFDALHLVFFFETRLEQMND